MGSLRADDQGVVVRCRACGRKNRIAWAYLADEGRCGACGQGLGTLASPLEIASDTAFDALVEACPVPLLVDFWAAWCGPCLMVAPELEKVAASASGRLVVAKVSTEELPALAQRFHVTSIPSMSVFFGGKERGRTAGARPAEAILAFVDQSLARAA